MIKESEKTLERNLVAKVKDLKGWAIKLLPFQVAGLPDRLVLMPEGKVYFVEVKSTGKKATKLQLVIHKRLESLGFTVYVIDTTEKLIEFIVVIKC